MNRALYTIETYKYEVIWFRILKDRLLDAREIDAIGQALLHLTDMHPRLSLVLEMDKVSHMSSAMLGKLVALHKAVRRGKGRLAICNLHKSLMPLFKVTKLDKIFDMQPDAQELLLLWQRKPLLG
jgi:anti-sigma B factor antagonist